MSVNPAGTKWSVAEMDNTGKIGSFHPTPWEFDQVSMNAGTIWAGGYQAISGSDASYACQIIFANTSDPSDSFEVHFLTTDRFVATKGGKLYRFGKKV